VRRAWPFVVCGRPVPAVLGGHGHDGESVDRRLGRRPGIPRRRGVYSRSHPAAVVSAPADIGRMVGGGVCDQLHPGPAGVRAQRCRMGSRGNCALRLVPMAINTLPLLILPALMHFRPPQQTASS